MGEESKWHCNICHQFDGDETGMLYHFAKEHPREWKQTENELDKDLDQE